MLSLSRLLAGTLRCGIRCPIGPSGDRLERYLRHPQRSTYDALTYWNFKSILLTFAVIGGAIAAAIAFSIPSQYQSTSIMRITTAGSVPVDGHGDFSRHIGKMEQEVLSRSSLEGLITRLGLYQSRRREMPMEDIVQDMRNHEISIRPIREAGGNRQDAVAFSISTTYPDPNLAQAMNRELVSKFVEQNVMAARGGDPSAGETLEVLDPASLPGAPFYPHRGWFAFLGLFAGLLAGLTVAYAMRWRIMIVRRPAH